MVIERPGLELHSPSDDGRSLLVRMVDLRGANATRRISVEARASSGAELLRCAATLLARDRLDLDIGSERVTEARERVDSELWSELQWLSGDGSEMALLLISAVAATVPSPGTVAQVRAAFLADHLLPWQLLFSHLTLSDHPRVEGLTDELIERVCSGDGDALGQVRALDLGDDPPAGLAVLRVATPTEYRDRLVAFISAFDRAVFQDLVDEAMASIGRDVERRETQLADGVPPAQVVLEATNGFEIEEDDPTLRRVVLLPSFWFRPWLVISRLGETEVLSTPVADQFVCLPAETPPPGLVKLAKALADEGRLRLLRRMAAGPISLTEAMDELEVAKATAHHHLSLLRQAGLVSLRGEGRRKVYGLRGDPSDAASVALAGYLRGDRAPVGS